MKLASDKSDSFNQNTVLKQTGSFWLDYLKDRSQARALAAACNKIKLFNYFENALNQLISQPGLYLNDFFAKYSFEKIFFTQDTEYSESLVYFSNEQLADLFKTLKETGEYPAVYNQSESGIGFYIINKSDLVFENIGDVGLEAQHFEFDTISIHSPKVGKLVVNNDFFETQDFLLFVENPSELFEDDKILISRAYAKFPTIYRYPFRIGDVHKIKNNKHFSLFSRFEQSIDKFRLALTTYSGVGLVDETSELLEKVQINNTVTYIFDKQILDIDYDHEELEVGTSYKKNLIIGDGLKVYYNNGTEGWWRAIDWKFGLTMSVISDREDKINQISELAANLKIPNESFEVQDNGTSSTGKTHIKIELVGSAEKQDAYWEYVKQEETRTNVYLSDIAALTYENPLDLFFKYILDKKSIVVYIDENTVPYPEKAVEFVRREAPVGGIVIILYKKKINGNNLTADNHDHSAAMSSTTNIKNANGDIVYPA